MEKTTKKKKKTKSLRRRIGIIAVGGLSLVMTICLSVGATLAWFAGSTWSDENLYMGGPVYVEMAGRGASAETNGDGTTKAKWQGGTGSLDIQASAARTSGTAYSVAEAPGTGPNGTAYVAGDYLDAMGNKMSADAKKNIDRNVLLPGQKFEIYSQARVYSTATTSTIADSDVASNSSGANVTNKSGTGMAYHRSNNGRITTTTTSVLRARFSISVEFDPSVGFGNFTNASYMLNYPVQSSQYKGDGIGGTWTPDTNFEDGKDDSSYVGGTPLDWDDALTDTPFTVLNKTDGTTEFSGRRDAVKATVSSEDLAKGVKPFTSTQEAPDVFDTDEGADNSSLTSESSNDLLAIQKGNKKSIYSWKYVSEATYKSTKTNGSAAPLTVENISDIATKDSTVKYVQMGYPFDGHDTSTNSNGYYGVWIIDDAGTGIAESDAFYKARCNAYLQTYVEEFESEYGNIEKKTIADSLLSLESALNQSFVNLVNDSSDDIHAGFTKGFTVDETTGEMVPSNKDSVADTDMHDASWLYIDPSIGNDTNTNEISTSTGGWWYLVADDGAVGGVATGTSEVTAVTDSVEYDTTTGKWMTTGASPVEATSNDPETAGTNFKRLLGSNGGITATDPQRLTAKLYEIKPNAQELEIVGMNNTTGVKKIVSPAFPFVNGSSALPGDALTNVFANAKISFQISFQAMQAFFPYTETIDKIKYDDKLLGTQKALNIANAIPIYNEARN